MVAQKKKLLIVDDHAVFSESLKLVLGEEFEVQLCTSSDELFSRLSESDFDLLLLDLTFPDDDGFAIFTKLRSANHKLPVLLITAIKKTTVWNEAKKLGVNGYFHKAENLDSLQEAIQSLLGGGEWWPSGDEDSDTDRLLKQHGLTARQYTVLQLIDKGYTNADIAIELFVSESTVKSHVTALYTQLAVKNRTSCLRTARILGLLS